MEGNVLSLIAQMEKVLRAQLNVQRKIFTYLNSYAKKEHMDQWSRVDPHAVLGQVYGDLAAGFKQLEDVVTAMGGQEKKE